MKLIYGQDSSGSLISIADVESGLRCNCICPYCKGVLIARKGLHRTSHFAHKSADCKYAQETALHLLAKEIIQKGRRVAFPSLYVNSNFDKSGPKIELIRAEIVNVDNVLLENRVNNIIPDIVVEIGSEIYLIEIIVSHNIDKAKYEKIKNLGISTFQIDLSTYDKMPDKSSLEALLFSDTSKSSWIYNSLSDNILSDIQLFYNFKQVRNSSVLNCPKNGHYSANLDSCRGCSSRFDYPSRKPSAFPSIACVHDYKEDINKVIRRHDR